MLRYTVFQTAREIFRINLSKSGRFHQLYALQNFVPDFFLRDGGGGGVLLLDRKFSQMSITNTLAS